jgi:hypothetical protein
MNLPTDYEIISPAEREIWRRVFRKLPPVELALAGLPPDAMDRVLDALQATEIDRHYLADRLCAYGVCASGTCPDPKPTCTECWEMTAVKHRRVFADYHPRYSNLNL